MFHIWPIDEGFAILNNTRRVIISWCSKMPWADDHSITSITGFVLLYAQLHMFLKQQRTANRFTLILNTWSFFYLLSNLCFPFNICKIIFFTVNMIRADTSRPILPRFCISLLFFKEALHSHEYFTLPEDISVSFTHTKIIMMNLWKDFFQISKKKRFEDKEILLFFS